MSIVTCPECKMNTAKGKFHSWQILVAICFFPLGMLALLADRQPTQCNGCGNTWQA